MPHLDIIVLVVALAPWLTLGFVFSRSLPLLSSLLAHAQATRTVGGEPAALLERRLLMEEADRVARRELDVRTFELQAKEIEAGLTPRVRRNENFDPPLIPRPFIMDPTGPIPPQD
jgi:hypothetical protein